MKERKEKIQKETKAIKGETNAKHKCKNNKEKNITNIKK